jgi:hypothetical protein
VSTGDVDMHLDRGSGSPCRTSRGTCATGRERGALGGVRAQGFTAESGVVDHPCDVLGFIVKVPIVESFAHSTNTSVSGFGSPPQAVSATAVANTSPAPIQALTVHPPDRFQGETSGVAVVRMNELHLSTSEPFNHRTSVPTCTVP